MLSKKIDQLLDTPIDDNSLTAKAIDKGFETPVVRELLEIGAVAGFIAMVGLQNFEGRVKNFIANLPNRRFKN